MNKESRPHPDHEWLLLLSDGELPAEARQQMREHLESCWECRHELQQIEAAIGDAVRYRKEVGRLVPAAPAPWRDLSGGFAKIDRELAPPGFFERMASALRMPRYALPFAAALAAAAVGSLVYVARAPEPASMPTSTPLPAPKPIGTNAELHTAAPVPTNLNAPESEKGITQPAQTVALVPGDAASVLSSTVRVYALLQEQMADLGEPIEVSRANGFVIVRGFGLEDRRIRELEQALEAIPYVDARLNETGQPTSTVSVARWSAGTGNSPFHAELSRALGGESSISSWVDASLDQAEAVMLHAHSLRRLNEAFAGEALRGDDAAIVRRLKRQKERGIAQESARLARTLAPALRAIGAPESAKTTLAPSDDSLFATARQLEAAVAELTGAKVLSGSVPDLGARLATVSTVEAMARSLSERD